MFDGTRLELAHKLSRAQTHLSTQQPPPPPDLLLLLRYQRDAPRRDARATAAYLCDELGRIGLQQHASNTLQRSTSADVHTKYFHPTCTKDDEANPSVVRSRFSSAITRVRLPGLLTRCVLCFKKIERERNLIKSVLHRQQHSA